ncbi:gastrin [Fukomys damarensis]|uniref:Gastrin n=1 Tax=Fukomys damarensis TaxID=885580 RepID=A0A091E0B1_FUKDA|nr:gastrin [Fukomys damarensis]KFO28521.1 Gastrin [Fukomys damarensis]
MPHLYACSLALMLTLAASSEASWRPRSQQQAAPWGPSTSRGVETHWLDLPGPASAQRRQLGPPGPPHPMADLSKKQGPWAEEEEAAYGWMDFGRRSAEDPGRRP